jgi:uncharacterized protein
VTYTWDSKKNLLNVANHGIAFEDAIRTLERLDDRFDYGETRVYAIGLVNGIETTVIYTDVSGSERRIISAWRSERYEKESYWRSVG